MAAGRLVATERRIYVRSVTGDRVEALDALRGTTLWTSGEQARPLWAWRDRVALLIRGPGKELVVRVVRDTPRGPQKILTSASLGIPAWVPLYDGAAQRHSITNRVQVRSRGNDLWLAWSAVDQVITGIAPPMPEQQSEGAVRVDLTSGMVARLGEPKLPPDPERAIPSSLSGWRLSGGRLWAPCRCGGPDEPLRSGRFVVSVELEIARLEKEERVWLLRWSAGTAKPEPPLLLDEGGGMFTILSRDGDHVLTSERARTWAIYELETGRLRGRVTLHGLAEMSILGRRLLAVHQVNQKTRLDVYDLGGDRMWSRALWSSHHLPPVP